MPKKDWSPETVRLRAAASEALDVLARSMQKDREAWGYYDELSDEDKESNRLNGKQATAWLSVVQYQGFDDPEISNVVFCTSGSTAAMNRGLASFAADSYR
jgi:hypothetical protein